MRKYCQVTTSLRVLEISLRSSHEGIKFCSSKYLWKEVKTMEVVESRQEGAPSSPETDVDSTR
jgi:hypothetical protein